MTEETTPTEPNGSVEPNNTPQPTPTDLIANANAAAARLEAANRQLEINLTRQEAMNIERTLGGKAEASQPPVEESPKDYANKVMANDI